MTEVQQLNAESWSMTDDNFAQKVLSIVGPTLSRLGFTVDEVDGQVDEGGRSGAVVYFRSQSCKVQIYWSAREGEINCMFGPLDALNEHGLYNRSNSWHYLTEFLPAPELPLEELVETLRAERSNFEDSTQWLRWIARRIEQHYGSASAGVRKLNG